MFSIIEMWSDSKGLMAKLKVLGERPQRPFEMGTEVYLASEEQITKILGISNPPNLSVSVGKLLGYPYSVNLLVKNFGRIFITGKSGSGKSYTMGVLCEEFLKKGIPIVIIDRHGEYGSLKVANEDREEEDEVDTPAIYCPWCGKEVESDSTECKGCGKSLELELPEIPASDEFQPIEEDDKPKGGGESEFVDNIIEFADLKTNQGGDIDLEYMFSLEPSDLVAPNLCTIVNLRGMSLEIQEIIAGKLLKKLFQASTSREIPPFYLFLDEAHLFAGKKQTETCDTVKLFAQEGRKFGANIVIGTQRPQLLDTTIRAQAGSWIVHNLSDIRDIGITISSAEDLSNENKSDISGLDKGQAIVCGEAAAGIPLFVQVRKRRTKHGATGFNALDFLSKSTVEELKKRRERILSQKTEEELEDGKAMLQDIIKQKFPSDHLEDISSSGPQTTNYQFKLPIRILLTLRKNNLLKNPIHPIDLITAFDKSKSRISKAYKPLTDYEFIKKIYDYEIGVSKNYLTLEITDKGMAKAENLLKIGLTNDEWSKILNQPPIKKPTPLRSMPRRRQLPSEVVREEGVAPEPLTKEKMLEILNHNLEIFGDEIASKIPNLMEETDKKS